MIANCPHCAGLGEIYGWRCRDCGGSGDIKVDDPAPVCAWCGGDNHDLTFFAQDGEGYDQACAEALYGDDILLYEQRQKNIEWAARMNRIVQKWRSQ